MPQALPIKITLYGYGSVGKILSGMIDLNPNLKVVRIKTRRSDNVIEDTDSDITIEAVNDVEAAKEIVANAIINSQDVITCNKELVHTHRIELFQLAEHYKKTIYLNSIVSGVGGLHPAEFKENLTNINFEDYIHLNPFGFRGAGAKETAIAMYKELELKASLL